MAYAQTFNAQSTRDAGVKARNGYEIRTEILALAQQLALSKYQAEVKEWDAQSNVAKPVHPTLTSIISDAQEMYDFVNTNVQPARSKVTIY